MMTNDFHFLGFDPSDDLRSLAFQSLERILNRAPYESHHVALLEKLPDLHDEDRYRCAIEIYTRHGPFTARAERSDPSGALFSAERAITQKLQTWTERRFQAMRGKQRILAL